MSLLQVTGLRVTFPTDDAEVHAVRGVDLRVDPGEVVALVGESGSGKSATAMAVIGLLPEYAGVSGSVRLHGNELLGRSDAELSRVRGAAIGTVFQDPMSALTPVYTVGDQIAEAITVHHGEVGRSAARRRAVELLELVGISQAPRRSRAFPHELSGGERQRVVIAMAIANDPDLLICDEPTTALDVTVQAQILDVLRTARDVTGAGVLIISASRASLACPTYISAIGCVARTRWATRLISSRWKSSMAKTGAHCWTKRSDVYADAVSEAGF